MVRYGYAMMTEQAGPRDLVAQAVGAERVGFDFSVISGHSFPWLESQGHAPYAWSVLGAAAQATSTPPIGIAMSGERSCAIAGRYGDLAIATEPRRELLAAFDAHGGAGKPCIGQLPVCYDTDRDAAITRAHDQFRRSLGGWQMNAELPGPAGFGQATAHVRPEDVADAIPCGNDVHAFVEAVRPFHEAGFTEIALIQAGGDRQEPIRRWAHEELLPALRGPVRRGTP
ncbi:LLM class flavin-dependent oxidoreductase [Streptomyces sp. NPDC006482]|uniref:LLM class flavin-dependent oxidoreductase n=1 Tax=Streptomyces sp. NPDC006482 TaxID=3154306 RepID=UPI0033B6EDD0